MSEYPDYHGRQRLEQRVQRLLTQLRVLSEAESTSVVHFTKHSAKGASKAPKGAFRGRAPDPDEGLLIWFLHRLERTHGEAATNALCAEGEVRLAKRLKRQPGREAGSGFQGVRESATERDRRIAEEYVGLDPMEVSVIESERSGFVSPANVRLVRMRDRSERAPHGRDGEDGTARKEMPTTFEGKRQLAQDLKTEFPSMSVTDIAKELGVARATVSRWLGDSNGEKAA